MKRQNSCPPTTAFAAASPFRRSRWNAFRQFLLRGLDRVCAEWSLVTTAWNNKRMAVLARTC